MKEKSLTPIMNAYKVNSYLTTVYPQINDEFSDYSVVDVASGRCVVRLEANERHLRPGGTVSGPCLFTLADIGGYTCVLSHAGPEALSVTTNLSINFIRKPVPGRIEAVCRILKLGRSLMVFDADIISRKEDFVVAHATGTYATPPKRRYPVPTAIRDVVILYLLSKLLFSNVFVESDSGIPTCRALKHALLRRLGIGPVTGPI